MAEDVRTGKGFQAAVIGGLAIGIAVLFGISITFLETTTIITAAGLVAAGLILLSLYLLVEL